MEEGPTIINCDYLLASYNPAIYDHRHISNITLTFRTVCILVVVAVLSYNDGMCDIRLYAANPACVMVYDHMRHMFFGCINVYTSFCGTMAVCIMLCITVRCILCNNGQSNIICVIHRITICVHTSLKNSRCSKIF